MKKLYLTLVCFLNVFFYCISSQTATSPNGGVYHEDALALPFPKSDYSQIVGLSSAEYRDVSKTKAKGAITGSPYLFENWHNKAKLFFRDKVYYLNSCNYNIYAERFEAKLTEDSVFVINSWNVKKVIINDQEFSQYPDPESQKSSYFEELVDFDDYRILRKHNIKVESGAINPLTKEKLTDDEFIKKEIYYLYDLKNNTLTKIKLKSSSIQSLLKKEKLEKVIRYVEVNHLKYNEAYGLVKIIEYYNNILD